MEYAGCGSHAVRRLSPSDGRKRRERRRREQQEQHDGVILRAHRRRRPDRMRGACTLLACGWIFQRWGCTDGFTGSVWSSSLSAAVTKTAAATTAAAAPATRTPPSSALAGTAAASSAWQRRPLLAVASRHSGPLGDHHRRFRRRRRHVSGAALACSQTGATSTLEVQENGGDDTRLGGAAWVEDVVDEDGEDFDDTGPGGNEDETGDIDRKMGKQRKPMSTSSGGRNKLFDLLNDLEGGGGCEAIDFLDIGGVGGVEAGSTRQQQHGEEVVDLLSLGSRQQHGEGVSAEAEGREEQEGMVPLELLKRTARRKFLSRLPPLTRSQSEEWRVLPMAERIQELGRTGRKDPRRERNWREAMQVLAEVKEEHGERGLGLTFIYGVAMRVCLDFGHPEEVLRLFREVKTLKDSPPNRQMFDSVIVAYCQLKQRDAAVDMLVEMKESGWVPAERSYVKLLNAMRGTEGASAVADRVLRLYADEEDFDADGLLPRNMDVCFQYLMVLAREQQWEQMLDFFRQLMERSRPPPNENCFGAVLYGLNAAGRWEETVSVMDSFRLRQVDKPKRGVYLSALSTLLKVAKRDELEKESEAAMEVAMILWKEFQDWGLYEDIRPESAANLLHSLFTACYKHDKYWPTAMEVFKLLDTYEEEFDRDENMSAFRGRGAGADGEKKIDKPEPVMPTAGEYRSMLLILSRESARGANWERSLEVLREAQELEYPITEACFQTVITDLGYAGQPDLAFSIQDEMRMAGIPSSVNTYNRLLAVCEKSKNWDRAFKILDEMRKANLKPDIISFGAAISACGKGLEWRRALALLVRMQHDGIMPNLQCFNAVIHGLGLAREWKRAEAIMEVIRKTGLEPDGYTYNSLAMAYATAGESDRALDVLETMENNGVQPDAVTYGTLMKACEGEGAFSIMRSLMDEMDQRGIPMTVNHYTTCIDAANRMEGTGMGWELWRQMGVKGVEPNNYAYSAIITTAAIDRDVRTALRLLEEMKTKEMDIDVVSYTSAICACGPDWLLALDVLEDMAKDGVAPNLLSYTAAMGACFKGEEPREVINVFNRMKEAGVAPDLRAYNLAMMAHDVDENHHGRASLEAELTEAGLSLQDKEWETPWMPPPELEGGYSEIAESTYDVGPPSISGGGGGKWGDRGSGGGGYGQFDDYEGDVGKGHDEHYDDESW